MSRFVGIALLCFILFGLCAFGLPNNNNKNNNNGPLCAAGSVNCYHHATLLSTDDKAVESAKKTAESAHVEFVNVENAAKSFSDAKEKALAAVNRATTAEDEIKKVVDAIEVLSNEKKEVYTINEALSNATRSSDAVKEQVKEANKLHIQISLKMNPMNAAVTSAKEFYNDQLTPALKTINEKQGTATEDEKKSVVEHAATFKKSVENSTELVKEIIRLVAMSEVAADEAERRLSEAQNVKKAAESATNEYKGPCPSLAGGRDHSVDELRDPAVVAAEKTAGLAHVAIKLYERANAKKNEAVTTFNWIKRALDNAPDDARNVVQAQKSVAEGPLKSVERKDGSTRMRAKEIGGSRSEAFSKVAAIPMCREAHLTKKRAEEVQKVFTNAETTEMQKVFDGFVDMVFLTATVTRAKEIAESAVNEARKNLREQTTEELKRSDAASKKAGQLHREANQLFAKASLANGAVENAVRIIERALKDSADEDKKRLTELLEQANNALKEVKQAVSDVKAAHETLTDRNSAVAAYHFAVETAANKKEAEESATTAENSANQVAVEFEKIKDASEKAVEAEKSAKKAEVEATELAKKSKNNKADPKNSETTENEKSKKTETQTINVENGEESDKNTNEETKSPLTMRPQPGTNDREGNTPEEETKNSTTRRGIGMTVLFVFALIAMFP